MTALHAAATNPAAAGLIAAALYTVTYFAFVRVLRFPRNWIPFRMPETIGAGLLVIITIAWISLTPEGPDPFSLANLAVSTGFFVIILSVIAAPTIAFHPANPVVEYLAKNAKYAGLWLSGPALIAGFAIPDIKLQAVLATAMAIELSWFLRHHWEREPRQLYPFTESDRSVLKAQAKGDLAGFRVRHAIHELEITGDDVAWRGCGKNTPPCPFNLYVNRLGLNTAPCCRAHMRDICHDVAASLKDIGAVHWLEGGSLLGAVREDGQLLEWEDDIDLSVLLDDDMTWDRLVAGLQERGARDGYYVDGFEQEGLVIVSFDLQRPGPFSWERNRMRGEIRVDMAVYRPAMSHGEAVLQRGNHKGGMPLTESGGYGVPRDIVVPTSTIAFEGVEVSCPKDPDAYLRILYGDFEKVEYTYVDPAASQNRPSDG